METSSGLSLPEECEESAVLGTFECNICFEVASEPVITMCGHMYCWPCLYRWISLSNHQCPVCKGAVDENKVIPLYGRREGARDAHTLPAKEAAGGAVGRSESTHALCNTAQSEAIPERPRSLRLDQPPVSPSGEGRGVGFNLFAGNFPSLGVYASSDHLSGVAEHDELTIEQQQQVFLSRLLLMLGSFVIMCLLLF